VIVQGPKEIRIKGVLYELRHNKMVGGGEGRLKDRFSDCARCAFGTGTFCTAPSYLMCSDDHYYKKIDPLYEDLRKVKELTDEAD